MTENNEWKKQQRHGMENNPEPSTTEFFIMERELDVVEKNMHVNYEIQNFSLEKRTFR